MTQAQSARTMSAPLTNSKIESEYRARTSGSAKLYEEARKVIPAGLTHDSRTLLPYPIYAARAGGPLQVGRRRQRIRRLFRRPRRAPARPRPSGGRRGRAAPGTQGTHWGSSHRTGSALGAARPAPYPVRGTRTLHRVGHRSLASRATPCPRLHRQTEGDPFRRPFSRLARPGRARRDVAFRRWRSGRHSAEPRRADHSAAGR